jgi:RNA polymerase sigma-70 factor (ECF subfamily)
MDVLGWSAVEAAETLDTSVAAANSALQRARATMASRNVVLPGAAAASEDLSDLQRKLLERYVAAFECYDVDQLVTLMRQDVAFSMPPLELWLAGPKDVREWMLGRGSACKGSRLIPTTACGSPAFAQYCVSGAVHVPGECAGDSHDGHQPFGLVVLEIAGEQVAGVTTFLDTGTLFPLFGLPMELPAAVA